MPVTKGTLTELPNPGEGKAWTMAWAAIPNGNSGDPLVLHDYADRSVEIEGTIGAGGSVQIEGSNDGTNYRVLHDTGLNNLVFTSTGKLSAVLEATLYIRPNVTAGDGTTAITVTLYARKTAR